MIFPARLFRGGSQLWLCGPRLHFPSVHVRTVASGPQVDLEKENGQTNEKHCDFRCFDISATNLYHVIHKSSFEIKPMAKSWPGVRCKDILSRLPIRWPVRTPMPWLIYRVPLAQMRGASVGFSISMTLLQLAKICFPLLVLGTFSIRSKSHQKFKIQCK